MVGTKGRFAAIRADERPAAAWGFLSFFAILSSYYLLRPLRDEMGIIGGVKNLSWQFTATFVVMLIVVPVYSAIAARYPRRKIISLVYRCCEATLLAFVVAGWLALPEIWIARTFFVWTSVYSVLVVSVYWSFLVDTFREEQGKRLFGAIAAGGSLGGLAGPALAALLVKPLGRAGILVAAAVLLEAGVLCAWRLIAWSDARVAPGGGRAPDAPVGGGIWAGFRLALGSPYLLAISGMLLAYSFTSTVIYRDQARIVAATVTDSAARTALFAQMELGVNIIALIAQGLLTGWILTTLGLLAALCLLPFVTAGGVVALMAAPGLATLVVVQIVRRGLQYGVERPAREVLFTVVSREEKYKAKSFIDIIVFRGGDALSTWIYDGMGALAFPPLAFSTGMLFVCAGWTALARYAARRNRSMVEAQSAS